MKTFYLCVRGINWFPGFSEDWTERVTHRINTRTPYGVCDRFQYACGPLTRNFRDSQLGKQFSGLLEHYTNENLDMNPLTIAAHSNGADVVLDGLALQAWPRIRALHLFAPAVDASRIVAARNVDEIHVYLGGKDWALTLAQTPAGHALGFGSPAQELQILQADPRVTVVLRESFGHDDWFRDIDETVNMITGVYAKTQEKAA